MGRQHDRKFSTDQRDAVIAAVLEHGLTASEAAQAAADGRLGDPFEPSVTTVQGWVAAHKRREGVEAAGQEESRRVRAVAEKTIARVEAMDAPTAKDLHALREAQRLVHDTDRRAPREAPRPRESSAEGRELIARMLADLEKRKAVEAGAPCDHRDPNSDGLASGAGLSCWYCGAKLRDIADLASGGPAPDPGPT
jgi:transposase